MKKAHPATNIDDSKQVLLKAVDTLAQTCQSELEHTHQVTRLSLRLFDELRSLHHYGEEERFWLECAARLHDIGWVEGVKAHHKTSLRIILESQLLPMDNRERLLIGSIARYHRKALPSLDHPHYASLEPAEREMVSRLAALLRIADGLDCTHQNRVEDLSCTILPEDVVIRCKAVYPVEEEKLSALQKADLFIKVFKRRIILMLGS